MLKDKSNSRKQGDVGLGSAIAWFTQEEYTVCVPLTDNQDYDLVVEKDCGLKKVQVKTTFCKSKHGIYKVNLRVFGGNQSRQSIKKFDKTKVDFIYALTEEGQRYLIPTKSLDNINSISLGKLMNEYKVS